MSLLLKNTVKCFTFISTLIEFAKGKALTGYDMLVHLRTFGFEVSPGTVYHQFSVLAKDGLIVGTRHDHKTVYEMTEKGMDVFDEFKNTWKTPLEYAYQGLC